MKGIKNRNAEESLIDKILQVKIGKMSEWFKNLKKKFVKLKGIDFVKL